MASTKPSVPQQAKAVQEPAQQVAASTEPVTQSQTSHTAGQRQQATQPTSYPNDTFLDWVARQVNHDPERIQGICAAYNVQRLAQLSAQQRENLTKRLRRQANGQKPSSPTPLQATRA
jgi:hypothetical protein